MQSWSSSESSVSGVRSEMGLSFNVSRSSPFSSDSGVRSEILLRSSHRSLSVVRLPISVRSDISFPSRHSVSILENPPISLMSLSVSPLSLRSRYLTVELYFSLPTVMYFSSSGSPKSLPPLGMSISAIPSSGIISVIKYLFPRSDEDMTVISADCPFFLTIFAKAITQQNTAAVTTARAAIPALFAMSFFLSMHFLIAKSA